MAAYAKGYPVAVHHPGGWDVLVVGFVVFEDGVAFMTDGYLIPMYSAFPEHHLYDKIEIRADYSLVCKGHRFYALEDGEELIGAYNEWFPPRGRIPQSVLARAVQTEAEHILKLQRLDAALVKRNVVPSSPGSGKSFL